MPVVVVVMANPYWDFVCVGHCSKCFSYINSLTLTTNFWGKLSPFYRWGNWGQSHKASPPAKLGFDGRQSSSRVCADTVLPLLTVLTAGHGKSGWEMFASHSAWFGFLKSWTCSTFCWIKNIRCDSQHTLMEFVSKDYSPNLWCVILHKRLQVWCLQTSTTLPAHGRLEEERWRVHSTVRVWGAHAVPG